MSCITRFVFDIDSGQDAGFQIDGVLTLLFLLVCLWSAFWYCLVHMLLLYWFWIFPTFWLVSLILDIAVRMCVVLP